MISVCSRLFFALFLGVMAHTSAPAQEKTVKHPLSDQIIDKQDQVVTSDMAAQKIRRHAYVFVGEKHDNPKHHQIELDILRMRFGGVAGDKGHAVFEMLDESQDAVIAQLKSTQNLDEMKLTLQWPNKGWDWNSYGPLFREAVQFNALKSGNISRAMVSTIYKDGQKILASTPKLLSATQQSANTQNYLLDQIFASHCGMQSRETLQPMLHIQLAKDASMASAMASHSRSILVAGGEHVRPNTGVPAHLKTVSPQADTLVIQLVEVKADKLKLNDYLPSVGVADLYWFTEATPEQDYCAGVKGRAAQ